MFKPIGNVMNSRLYTQNNLEEKLLPCGITMCLYRTLENQYNWGNKFISIPLGKDVLLYPNGNDLSRLCNISMEFGNNIENQRGNIILPDLDEDDISLVLNVTVRGRKLYALGYSYNIFLFS